MKLKTFTVNDIRMLRPCYDPVTGLDHDGNPVHPGGFLSESWTGTALDVLRLEACPVEDRLWVVCHEGWIDDHNLRLFAVWCARQALRLVDNPDPRSVEACNVAERFANGRATSQELFAAKIAAGDAVRDSAGDPASEAAWSTVWVNADDAAWSAAGDSAEAAARAAAESVAEDPARAAARKAQIKHLIEMLEAED